MADNLMNLIREKVVPIFLKDRRIVCAYLFGSFVQGEIHKRSDIDLAILTAPNKKFILDDLLDLEVKIALALNTERFDLVILNNLSLILKFRIIFTGKLIYVSDDDLRSDFEEKVMQEYYDFQPRLNEFNREYFATLKENYLR